MYRPLPPSLTIKESNIHGLGIFALTQLECDESLGITHVKDDRFEDGYIRLPLGGFFNHSENPNCECYKEGDYLKLKTIKKIKKGEEITVNYWLYEV
jgi:hypothetical protein